MDEQPAPQPNSQDQSAEAATSAASQEQKQEQTNSNRSDLQSVYPEAKAHAAPEPESVKESAGTTGTFAFGSNNEEQYQAAGVAFSEAITLGLGVASSISYLLIVYFVKSVWGTAVISALLALVAIVFAVKNYLAGGKMSPFSVIGISAATITLVYVGNMLVAQAVIRSIF